MYGLSWLRCRSDGRELVFRQGRRGAHTQARLLPERHYAPNSSADAEAQKGITVHERHIMPEELAGFEQCWLTGTAAEVTRQ